MLNVRVVYVGAPGYEVLRGRPYHPRCESASGCSARPRWKASKVGGRGKNSSALLCRHHADAFARRYGSAGLRAS